MKKIFYIWCVLLFCSCEVIEESGRLIELPTPVPDSTQAHVLIEYTGFRCVNCPKAADQAQELKKIYGERLIVVSMHPASNPFTQGLYNYTCEEADIYYKQSGGNASTAFPTGNIDMKTYGSTYLEDYTIWPSLVSSAMNENSGVRISTQAIIMAANARREVHITTTAFAEEEKELSLAVWLVEDSVRGVQAMPDGSVNMEYIHRHMLRCAAGEPWGIPIQLSRQPAQWMQTATIPEGCNEKRCEVVALVLNKDREIVNATSNKILIENEKNN